MRNAAGTIAVHSGQPRRRVTPPWRRPWAIPGAAVLALVLIGVSGSWLWQGGLIVRTANELKWMAIARSVELGLKVDQIYAVGRRQTSRPELLAAVGVDRGAPMLAVDPEAIRMRLTALPWVKSAGVQRMFPGTLYVTVVEREPVALWQHDGRFTLVDREGAMIRDGDVERFQDLLVVVGDDAPAHVGDLLRLLAAQPNLAQRVKAAVWIGGRRWNLRLEGGVDVRLPEENATGALARLAEYDRTHRVLDGDIQYLDLRLPDRLVLRRGTPATKAAHKREA